MTSSSGDPGPPRPRRAPAPEERRVDAEHTRAVLLDAALEEFAAKGFAGTRVRDIARRAGVSKDLIAYHFGGKNGLYLAVQRAWLERRGSGAEPDLSLAETITRFLRDTLSDPRPMRLKIWRGLSAAGHAPPDASTDRDHQSAAAMRRRQDGGELRDDLDPATLQLVLLGALAAPVIFPDDVRRLFGVDPDEPEFETHYRDGLRRLLRALRETTDQEGSP